MGRLTRKQAVLQVLLEAQRGKRYTFYHKTVPEGWVPLKELCNENTGGSEGTRRIREMRKDGINIILQDFWVEVYNNGKWRKEFTTIYRLKTPERYIDFERCLPKIPGMRTEPNGQVAIF